MGRVRSSAVELADLHMAFGDRTVLDGVDLVVEPGECMVLLGPSGCGKTTLLRLVAGLDRPTAGTVSIEGAVTSGPGVFVQPEHRNVGLVFQDGALFPHVDVTRNVGFGLDRSQRRGGPRVDQMLDLVGLGGLGDRGPDQLSGGQRQRVALARALAPEPAVMLLDEPFSNLDAVLRERLRAEVRDLLVAAGVTTIFVTHDRAEAFAVGDRVAIMRDGRIVQTGAPRELYDRPVDRWVAEFVGDVVEVVVDGDVRLLRPEQLELGAPGTGFADGLVERVRLEGPTTLVEVRSDDRLVTVRVIGGTEMLAGDAVALRVRAASVPPLIGDVR